MGVILVTAMMIKRICDGVLILYTKQILVIFDFYIHIDIHIDFMPVILGIIIIIIIINRIIRNYKPSKWNQLYFFLTNNPFKIG